ncbi:MAG: hypothetical protein ACI80V_001323 [Rhodothermales bacterium]|jgi:hypothetical protein
MKRIFSFLVVALALVSTGSAQTAADVLAKHIEAVGGEEAWSGVTDRHAKISVSVEIPQGVLVLDVEVWNLYPGYALAKTTAVSVPEGIPDLSSTVYVTPEGGFGEGMQFQGRQDFEGPPPAAIIAGVPGFEGALEELGILASMDSVSVELTGQEEMNGKMAHVVEVGGVSPSKSYYDVESGLLIARSQQSMMGTIVMMVSEYQEFDGLQVALIQEGMAEAGGQSMSQTFAMTAHETNTGLTAEKLAELAGSDN